MRKKNKRVLLLTIVNFSLLCKELIPDSKSISQELWVFLEFPFSSNFAILNLTSCSRLGSGTILSFMFFCHLLINLFDYN
jgi:hypothetical protein